MFKCYADTDSLSNEEDGLSEDQKEALKDFINKRFGRRE